MPRTFPTGSDFLFNDTNSAYSQTAAYSVAMWLLHAATTTELEPFSQGNRGNANPFFAIRTGPTSGKAGILSRNDAGGGSQINAVQTALTVFDGTWHHIAYAQDGSGNWQVYVDGAADSTAHGTFTPGATTINCVAIGCFRRTTTAGTFTAGDVAHCATWSKQLSAGECRSLAAGLPPSFLGPDHYWPLWGVDSPEPDIGIAAHTEAVLAGSPTGTTTYPPVRLRLVA